MKYKHNFWIFIISIKNNQKRKLLQFLKDIFSIQIYKKPEIWILSLGLLAHLSYSFPASAASFKKFNSLQQCRKAILNKEEFETKEDNQKKEEAVEAIKERESRDSKTQNILADSLNRFKGDENKASIRIKIYSLFESISQHITVKVARKLAGRIAGGLPSEEKKRIIAILKKRRTKDTLTIQHLGEGLNDPSPEVRKTTAEALGEMLGGEFALKTFIRELTDSLYDKDPGIRKEARKAFKFLNGKKALKEYYDVQDLKAKYQRPRNGKKN